MYKYACIVLLFLLLIFSFAHSGSRASKCPWPRQVCSIWAAGCGAVRPCSMPSSAAGGGGGAGAPPPPGPMAAAVAQGGSGGPPRAPRLRRWPKALRAAPPPRPLEAWLHVDSPV